jgi:DNA-binding NtrC family response regulator
MIPLKIMIADDDKNIRQTLNVGLKSLGCEPTVFSSAEEVLSQWKKLKPDFILTDFKMQGKSGIDLLKEVRKTHGAPLVVVMTAFASFENAVEAIRQGAYDYLPKPFSMDQLEHLISKISKIVNLERENKSLKRSKDSRDYFTGITSPAMVNLEDFINRVATTEATILIAGESGTGKTELARYIHARSSRSQMPFVEVSCTSLTESLLESELFGHVKGAFTGAISDHIGKLELANGGTLFLDEIGDLSLGSQSKFLRFLESRRLEKVGGNHTIDVNTRIIAATNRNLSEDVAARKFREDLYFRMNTFEYIIPPLRHRKEDIPVLIKRFLAEFKGSHATSHLPANIHDAFQSYSWPGNVRELRNTVERIALLAGDQDFRYEDLPKAVRERPMQKIKGDAIYCSLEEQEREHIQRLLEVEPNLEKASEILGISTSTLWRKRKEYGLV